MSATYNPHTTSRARCNHARQTGTVSIGSDEGINQLFPTARTNTCDRPQCIANSARWAAHQTGKRPSTAVYRPLGDEGPGRLALPLARDLALGDVAR